MTRLRDGAAAALLISASAALGAAAVNPVTQLAGRYSKSFENGLIDGSKYMSEDIVEIVTVDPRHSYVRLDLQFFNGHVCGLGGSRVPRAPRSCIASPASRSVMRDACFVSSSEARG